MHNGFFDKANAFQLNKSVTSEAAGYPGSIVNWLRHNGSRIKLMFFRDDTMFVLHTPYVPPRALDPGSIVNQGYFVISAHKSCQS